MCKWVGLVRMRALHLTMSSEKSRSPALVVLLCGKRKCGKDYVAARLLERYASYQ